MSRVTAIVLLIALVCLFGGCGGDYSDVNPIAGSQAAAPDDNDPTTATPPESGVNDPIGPQQLIKGSADVLSATLYVYVDVTCDQWISVYRNYDPWTETAVTWNTFIGGWVPFAYGEFLADFVGWHSVDVTLMVDEWLSGFYPNYGMTLAQDSCEYPTCRMVSKEGGGLAAYLVVCEEGADCYTVPVSADAFIYQAEPDVNYGLDDSLATGRDSKCGPEKQALIFFPLGTPEPDPASISDFVWYDDDQDGIQDPGEAGVSGVVVHLYTCAGTLQATTTTDAGGHYAFIDLVPGDYYIQFFLPDGHVFSPPNQGGEAQDSDADQTTGETDCTTLLEGENDVTWDAGIYVPDVEENASIGDRVWYDDDEDGIQDPGESGVEDVTVNLMSCAHAPLATTTTDADGLYRFDDLEPELYMLEFILPDDHVFSPRDQGSEASDSDVNPDNGFTVCTVLESGEVDLTWDAGIFVPRAALGDRVWNDFNRNGLQDDGEPGMPNIVVYLEDAGGILATTTTDASGLYRFEGLVPGSYHVRFGLPFAYVFSPQDQGTNDSLDSDANPVTGATATTDLEASEVDLTWDAGIYMLTSELGNYVWQDMSHDGIQDADEPGMPMVVVELYDCQHHLQAATTTDDDGYYGFVGLEPGAYYVKFLLPSGYVFSPQDEGVTDALDSDADPNTGVTTCTTLDPDENDPTWDAGVYPPCVICAEIGDFVWQDLDRNGIQDFGEPGLPEIVVELHDCGGGLLATTTTDGSGYYLFTDLSGGYYYVEFILPGGYVFTAQNQGSDNDLDSDVDPTTGRTVCFLQGDYDTDYFWDAGVCTDCDDYASIGDQVWFDQNQDGVHDQEETGIPNVTVQLYACGGSQLAATTTNANGNYFFNGLQPGEYYVRFLPPPGYSFTPANQGSDDTRDSDADPSTGMTPCTILDADENDDTWDAGLFGSGSSGCTQTIKYWRTHSGQQPDHPDLVTPMLPIWLGEPGGSKSLQVTTSTMAVNLLNQYLYGNPANGITMLYAHLLAAKLNIAYGTDPADVVDLIATCDGFLALYDWNDWQYLGLGKNTVLRWKSTLDNYNTGLIGPGYCGDPLIE